MTEPDEIDRPDVRPDKDSRAPKAESTLQPPEETPPPSKYARLRERMRRHEDEASNAAPMPHGGVTTGTIVKIYGKKIWIESDFSGDKHVMIQHVDGEEGLCEPFCYCSFHYDYRYTCNAGIWSAAETMARALGATDPIERKSRPFSFPDPEA